MELPSTQSLRLVTWDHVLAPQLGEPETPDGLHGGAGAHDALESWQFRAWLPRTKLQPPVMGSDLIPRPRLLDPLRGAVASRRLTLISAPAGYGKTSLLAGLAASFSGFPLAWLSLDQGDDDPPQFLQALIASLQQVAPDCTSAVQTFLAGQSLRDQTASPESRARSVIGLLINAVFQDGPHALGLVIDDLHAIRSPGVYEALDYLLGHMPPQMHLVVSTRNDPPLAIARLRASGELAEFRLRELQYTMEETAVVLNRRPGPALTPEEVALLHSRTEGWPAGLRMLAGLLEQAETPQARHDFVSAFPRGGTAPLFDYFASEVLEQQDPAIQAFLLETSILDELTPLACEAVTGQQEAGATLKEIQRRGLFVQGIGEDGTSFRYHDLLREFLRGQLLREQPGRVAELHCRAAQVEAVPSRAIVHWCAAHEWERAADLIVEAGPSLLSQGLLQALEGWIQYLPTAVRDSRPRLLYLLGACMWQRGDAESAEGLLQRALEAFEMAGDLTGQGEALAELADTALMRGDYGRMDSLTTRSLSFPLPPEVQVRNHMARTFLGYLRGTWSQAAQDFEDAVAVTDRCQEPTATLTLIRQLYPGYLALPGTLRDFERICRRADRYLGSAPTPLHVTVDIQRAFLHVLKADLKAAVVFGERALALADQLGVFTPNETDGAAALVVVYTAWGDYEAAEGAFQRLLSFGERLEMIRTYIAAYLRFQGQAYLAQGRLPEAREVYRRMCLAEAPGELPVCAYARTLMRGSLAQAEGRYRDAELAFRQAAELAESVPHSVFFGNASLAIARLSFERGRPEAAIARLAPVLEDWSQKGLPGLVFIDGPLMEPLLQLAARRGVLPSLIARLVREYHAGAKARPAAIPRTGETLTPREVEILRLVAEGESNRSIGTRLSLAEDTVKSHVYRLFRKLDASSRTQAIARARELHLV